MIKMSGVLFCALYLLMPLLQVSGELFHKIAHALNSQEITGHHHHAYQDSDDFYYGEEHHYAREQHGHHHRKPSQGHLHENSSTGHNHKAEHPGNHADAHDHEFLFSLQKLVNTSNDEDQEEGEAVPFELDKHLQPLCFEEVLTIQNFVTVNFRLSPILPSDFIKEEGKPPQFRIST